MIAGSRRRLENVVASLELLSDLLSLDCKSREEAEAYRIVAEAMFSVDKLCGSKLKDKATICPKCGKRMNLKSLHNWSCEACRLGISIG